MVRYQDGSVLGVLGTWTCVRLLRIRWHGPNRVTSGAQPLGFW